MGNPNQQFQQVQLRRPARSLQDGLSHDLKFTCDIGPLYPVGWWETLPGDLFKVKTTAFFRLEPLALPIFHDIEVYFHYFFIPEYMYNHNREKFHVPQENEGDSAGQDPIPIPLHAYTRDLYDLNFLAIGELLDFLGVPPIQRHVYQAEPTPEHDTPDYYEDDPLLTAIHGVPAAIEANRQDPTQRICLYPMFCYQLIYDCYYKPEKFVDSLDFDSIADVAGAIYQDDHDDWISQLCTLRRRGWEKDLFTSALPEPQQGMPAGVYQDLNDIAVSIFLRDASTVDSNNYPQFVAKYVDGDEAYYQDQLAIADPYAVGQEQYDDANALFLGYTDTNTGYFSDDLGPVFLNPRDSLVGNINPNGATDRHGNVVSNRLGFTIEEWRFAYGEQRFREDLARAGSRITEVIRSQFGVVADDLTLNRPRYLGGGKQMIAISEVLQQSTSEEGDSSRNKLGSFAGHGYSVGTENKFKARVNDYGIIMCIMSMRPRSGYGQGLPRYFSKFDRYDFFLPHLAHLGEQPVRNDELFMRYGVQEGGIPLDNDGEFGYQPIFHDYRYIPSRIAGYMRTNLQDMHLNRLFNQQPVLNADFIEMNPRDFDHIFAVGLPAAGEHVLGVVNHNVVAIRNVPKYGNPVI